MSSVSCQPKLISVGCNRLAHTCRWAPVANLVAYGAGVFVALYDPSRFRIVQTLKRHTGRVNTVLWLPTVDDTRTEETELLSAGTDKLICHWRRTNSKWELAGSFEAHADAVTSLSAIRLESTGEYLLASTSADCTVKVWRRKFEANGVWSPVQTLTCKPRPMETVALALAPVPGREIPMMVCGGTDHLVHLYVWDAVGGALSRVLSLQGHADWVRALSFCRCDNGDVLLASSAQDNYIRLWRVSEGKRDETSRIRGAEGVSQKGHVVGVGGKEQQFFTVCLDSVLSGHDDWVYSVQWHPRVEGTAGQAPHQPMELLSASMDRNMMVWCPEDSSARNGEGLWMAKARVGEMGGNTLGFYGGVWGPRGGFMLAHGYNGSFHLWRRVSPAGDEWQPQVSISGHFGPVEDVAWAPRGGYLMSASSDQTVRVFSRWIHSPQQQTWHEIARPQIHGYDLSCITFVPSALHKYVSGADEKVLRVFEAPWAFIETLQQISGVAPPADLKPTARPMGAAQPPLGLSNKPFYPGTAPEQPSEDGAKAPADLRVAGADDEDGGGGIDDVGVKLAPQSFSAPPFEEYLMQSSLWPETQKVYGHGNELFCVCSNHAGTLVASACRGTKASECAIRVIDTATWKDRSVLVAHTNTVAQLAFSHNDKWLLSASRDRSMCIFEQQSADGTAFKEVFKLAEAHERIIWSGSWSIDDRFVATASRDKHVKLWGATKGAQWTALFDWSLRDSATAVAFVPVPPAQLSAATGGVAYIMAVGLENGDVLLLASAPAPAGSADLIENVTWQTEPLFSIDPRDSHAAAVRKLSWAVPESTADRTVRIDLASGSSDHSVRVFSFEFSVHKKL